jgi:hypothetical protein
MLNVYTDNLGRPLSNITEQQIGAVSTLMYHAGVSVTMDFTSNEGGSAANSNLILPALKNHFGYDEIIEYVSRDTFSNVTWEAMLREQIGLGMPVYYAGGTWENGHAFVLDGYDNAGRFHFNWGWDGWYDGFFVTTALNPGDNMFNANQQAIINIIPADVFCSYCSLGSWSEWDTTAVATCVEVGSRTRTRTCNICDKTNTTIEEIPTVGHFWSGWSEWDTTIVATCKTTGSRERTRTCNICGATHVETEELSVLPMLWNNSTPPALSNGCYIITIASGLLGTLNVPENTTVTIIGEVAATTWGSDNRQINLNIPATSKVIWEAKYSSREGGGNNRIVPAITVTGGGEFVLVDGGTITIGGGANAINVVNSILTVNGGTITSNHGGTAIRSVDNSTININGGVVNGGRPTPAGNTALSLF